MFEFDFNDLCEKSQGEELIGTWAAFGRYGRKEYNISQCDKSQLWFNGPDASGGVLSGRLVRSGDWHEATVKISEGIDVGSIRVAFIEKDDSLLLNFRCSGEAAWGQDIFARREASAAAWNPLHRPAEFVLEGSGTDSLSEKERAKLLRLAEKFNPAVNVPEHVAMFGSWEHCHCDDAYEDHGEVLIVRPSAGDAALPAPVILFLLGNGHVDGREHVTSCGLDVMLQNEDLRSKFYIVVPKPCTRNGLVRYTGRGWEKEWNEDAVWFLFTNILRRLGAKRVDPARLCTTGISMGARGVWHLALKYGDMLAAACPISGQCYWPNETWTRGPLPVQSVMDQLTRLPLRAYQIDVDNYAGNPLRDIEWLTWGLEEKKRQINLNYARQKIEVQIREWAYKEGDGCMELWWVKGPLEGERGTDDHRLWLWVYEKRQWGLAQFFLKYQVPETHRWDFSSKPISVNTSDEKARLEALWALAEAPDDEEAKQGKGALVAELYGAAAT
mmetsp:Transcript_107890/g.315420  ORF Transcript_107890/g.315420 Transcript_107890/m.315420 type:complete len:499 (-) Transcript_107890:372-1868(-)